MITREGEERRKGNFAEQGERTIVAPREGLRGYPKGKTEPATEQSTASGARAALQPVCHRDKGKGIAQARSFAERTGATEAVFSYLEIWLFEYAVAVCDMGESPDAVGGTGVKRAQCL